MAPAANPAATGLTKSFFARYCFSPKPSSVTYSSSSRTFQPNTYRFDTALDATIQRSDLTEPFPAPVHTLPRLLEKLLRTLHRCQLPRTYRRCSRVRQSVGSQRCSAQRIVNRKTRRHQREKRSQPKPRRPRQSTFRRTRLHRHVGNLVPFGDLGHLGTIVFGDTWWKRFGAGDVDGRHERSKVRHFDVNCRDV
ncbi:hypothetical protein PHSY_001664 [Pseudozyma hubeiensis SY62]|uniref:Uncharacterized protein n=1 Tax=Pseudozyma hubeiensis (strain SY62) TaxID=1305764 RepID=R9P7K2_PSEHS|nr:hypothetical protein PHSY_001664 [Pseudozyma hubeiensis SY62]GAC94095.1 hypothetical protein PHSY_001664 [Pseudozyma hubeiensis SY62]